VKRYIFILSISILSLAISLTGCSSEKKPSAERLEIESEAASIDFPDSFQKDYDNQLRVDAQIIVPNELKGKKLQGAKAEYYSPKLETVKQKTEEYAGITLEEFDVLEDQDYEGITVYTHQYETLQEDVLSITYSENQNNLLYYPDDMGYVFYSFRLAEDPNYNAGLFLTGEEFAFAGMSDAFQRVKQYLEEIGIAVGEGYRCYSLSYETLRQEEIIYEEESHRERKEWSEKDNAYYFAMNQEANGLPVYIPLYGIYADDNDYNAPIQIMYKDSGIGFIQTGTMYVITPMETYVNPLGIEEIFDHVKEKYDMLISDDEVTITQAKLCWIPDKDSENLILGWSMRGHTSSGAGLQMFYDAQTGKELIGVSL
jgi:hypothetical protein